jgi:hypothetical protein
MAFMKAQVYGPCTWYTVCTPKGQEAYDDLASAVDVCQYFDLDVNSIKMRHNGYGARLSDAGYLDRTDWIIGNSENAVRQELADTYDLCPECLAELDEDYVCQDCLKEKEEGDQ